MSHIVLRLAPEDAVRIDALTAEIGLLAKVVEKCGLASAFLVAGSNSERGAACADPRALPVGGEPAVPSPKPAQAGMPAAAPAPAAVAEPRAAAPFSRAEPPETRGPRGGFYSPAQIAELKRWLAVGEPLDKIAPMLCRMADEAGAGARPTVGSLWQKIKVMREAGDLRAAKAAAPAPAGHPEYQRPAVDVAPARPRLVTKSWALQWANQRGLCADGVLDMDVVNAKAKALGIAGGFTLDPGAAMGRVV